MNYDVKVYQIVLNDKILQRNRERASAFTRITLGALPTQEDFNKFYSNMLSFNIDSEIKDVMDFCKFCFIELNAGNIHTNKYVDNLVVNYPHRSLSVGDILEINNKFFLVRMIGFSELPTVKSIGKKLAFQFC